jgi:adenylate cyclase
MPVEIERKFLVKSAIFKKLGKPLHIHQGFLSTEKERVVRVRLQGKLGFITIKGSSKGIARAEFEYRIPVEDARYMLEHLCLRPTIEKYRYRINVEGFTWEVDEFLGENEGLIVAELELDRADRTFPKPEWIGEEVTSDPRYYNANLVKNPYKSWKK